MPQIIGSTGGVLLRSVNMGSSWQQSTLSNAQSGDIRAVRMVGQYAIAEFGTIGNGVFGTLYSTDTGATWPSTCTNAVASDVTSDGHVLATTLNTGSSYALSTNGVLTNAAPLTYVPGATISPNRSVRRLALMDDGTGVALGTGTPWAISDFGATWSDGSGGAIPSASGPLKAGRDAGIYVMATGGAGYAVMKAPSYSYLQYGLGGSANAFDADIASNGAMILCGTGGSVWLSATPPGNFSLIPTPVSADLHGVAFLDDDYVVAVGDAGTIIMSSDGGHTWAAVQSGTTQDLLSVAGTTDVLTPNAPLLTAPAGAVIIDLGVDEPFTWSPSPASSMPQSAVTANDLRYKPVASSTWTTVTGLGAQGSYLLPAGSLTAGQYQWEARSYSAAGAGPWSLDAFFTAAARTPMPGVTQPASGAVIGGASMPVVWTTSTVQAQYQVRVMPDSDGQASGSPLYDSGPTVSTVQDVTVPATWTGTAVHVQVRAMDQGGLWSAWADVPVTINWQPPATPTLTLTVDQDPSSPTGGSILIQVTNPAPSGNEPDADTNVLWIIEGGTRWQAATVGKDGSWRYWTPLSGVDTGVQAVASASATGVTAASEITY